MENELRKSKVLDYCTNYLEHFESITGNLLNLFVGDRYRAQRSAKSNFTVKPKINHNMFYQFRRN